MTDDCKKVNGPCNRRASSNMVVLDLETANSPDDLETGWHNKAALGLAVAVTYDFKTGQTEYILDHSLLSAVEKLVERQPLLVSFNGIKFDFALMRGVLRERYRDEPEHPAHELCDHFKLLAGDSYDILDQIWRADPANKRTPGLNKMERILAANQMDSKAGKGEDVSRWWQSGQVKRVIEYCAQDVRLTADLFMHLQDNRGWLMRDNGPLAIPWVDVGGAWFSPSPEPPPTFTTQQEIPF